MKLFILLRFEMITCCGVMVLHITNTPQRYNLFHNSQNFLTQNKKFLYICINNGSRRAFSAGKV